MPAKSRIPMEAVLDCLAEGVKMQEIAKALPVEPGWLYEKARRHCAANGYRTLMQAVAEHVKAKRT